MNETPVISAEPEVPETDDGESFRRLHPLSIILKSVAAIGQNLIAMGVLYFSVFDRNLAYTGLAAIALLAFIIGITALIWSRFSYHIGPKEIRIKSGLLSRNNRSIPFDRIQDVSLEQKLVSRVLGLATVKLETGASAGEDGKLDALALADAEALRDTVRDYKSGVSAMATDITGETASTEDADERPPLFAMDNRRIFIAGLFNFSFILLAILGAIAQNLDFLLPDDFFNPWYWAEQLSEQDMVNGLSFSAQIAGAVGALVSLIAVGMGSGIIRTFIREYGFRLDRVDRGQPGFRRRRGLFTLTDMVMPIHRVQAAILKTGPIRQRFGWYHLKFQSLASDGSGESDHSAAPCAQMEEVDPILNETGITNVPRDLEFHRVDPALWWRDAIIITIVLGAVAVGNGTFVHTGFYALILLAIPIISVMILNWRHHQYALTANQLFVRAGWWRRKLTIVPIRKIQTVDVGQSPLDHPLDLATITVGIAGGSSMAPLKINDIPITTAMALRKKLI
ncbi:PH domain-containing protein [Parasphingorhabdus cellanae]|uniref:PH domain-containing protein n=1 Tax=Parasphingorhabdus cellanae TaxID=2806553 RepID=A0ABX7SZC2_9SPHN|nr:PH domain-containing protein [Parasphingorhabdus cellanae]QTD54631.1 PH domain-containing protein [Parasphingorhabdus cellanae]